MSVVPQSHRPWREWSFGFVSTFLSGFGQTFFIALFLVSLTGALGITEGKFGLLYGLATLVSGLSLPLFGRWLDRKNESTTFVATGLGLALSLVLLALTAHWGVMVLAIIGLRIFGQGAFSLIAMSAMAKYFQRSRGFALGISSLGFPFGEMLLPACTLALIGLLGWRHTLLFYAGALLVVVGFIRVFLLAKRLRHESSVEPPTMPVRRLLPHGAFRWWRDPFFCLVTAASVIMPLGGTIMFLYLVPITQSKGWSAEWLAGGFVLFAVIRATVGVAIGPIIDRVGGTKLYALSISPFVVAVAALWLAQDPWVGLLFFAMIGVAFGGGTVMTALLAEVYGTERIGEIRGLSTAAMVLSSALGPLLAGLAMEQGWGFEQIMIGLLAASCLSVAVAAFAPRLAKA
ncbi:MAG: MFS transporter [Verrucomicrobiales bacterium]